jgi:pilus assembly protein Flp/PilA
MQYSRTRFNQEGEMMFSAVKAFWRDECGATAIEYGLIAALVSIAAIVAMGAMGNELGEMFNTVASELDNAQN